MSLGREIEPQGVQITDALEDPFTVLSRSIRYSQARRPINDDLWSVDIPIFGIGEEGSYDHFFQQLLEEENVATFQGLLRKRQQQGFSTHILDLFGSGLFIEDMNCVDTITGARLLDPTQTMLQKLTTEIEAFDGPEKPPTLGQKERALSRVQTVSSSPKWSVVPGNLFNQTTWNKLDNKRSAQGFLFYDAIVIKPEGAYGEDEIFHPKDLHRDVEERDDIYALKFLRLLNNAYTRLTSQHGMIFAEVPPFISNRHLTGFQERLSKGNIPMSVMVTPYWHGHRNIKLVKQPTSAPYLERLVRAAPLIMA